jgi:hypothetical protein
MGDIRTIESAWLLAQSRFEQWQQSFGDKTFQPAVDTEARRAANDLMNNYPPEVVDTLRQAKPDKFAAVEQLARGGRNGNI